MNPSDDTNAFYDSVQTLLIRTGLLNERGVPEEDTMALLSRVYAALFYDALLNFFGNVKEASEFCIQITELQQSMEYRRAFHAICSSYEVLSLPLPETVLIISGHAALESSFAAGFIRRLAEFNGTE